MPIILPQKFIDEGERPQGTNPWLWLVEIELAKGRAGIPPVILRSTSGQSELRWPITFLGTGVGYLVNNGGGYGPGATSIAVDTGTGTMLIGDLLKFAGHATVYTVATALSGGVVVITPPLTSSVADNEAVTLGNADPGGTGAPITGHRDWYPFPFSFSPIEQTQEGDLPQLSIAVDNSGRFLMRYLHESDGLEGNRVDLFLVPSDSLALVFPNHQYQQWRLQVAEVNANDEAINLRLERPNFLQRNSPQDRYVPNRCRWPYGSTFCGYVLNGLAAFPTCPKTISACIERGEDMIARGFGPNVLPANYGGHPGVSVQR